MVRVHRKYGNLVELSPDAIVVYRDGRLELVNRACVALFGAASVDDLVGRSAFDLVPAAARALVGERIRRLLAGEPGVNRLELDILRLDGGTRRVEVNAARIEDDEGEAIEAILRDVSDERRAEKALRASEERLRAHIDNSPLAVIEFDPQFRVMRWSKEAERVFGWTADEMIGRRIEEVRWVHADDVECVRRESARLLSGEGTRTLNVNRNYRKDGAIIHCEWYSSALHDASGRLLSILSHVLDVTDRRRVEEELRGSEERFRTLADNISPLTWMADDRGSFRWCSKRWFDFTGMAPDDVLGWEWQKVVHPDHLGRVVEKVRRCLQTGELWEDTLPLRRRDGVYRWFLSRALPIRDESGRIVRWLGTDTDVTEQRDAQQAVQDADRRKTEFLAVLSHELRNHLAPITNCLSLLERAPPEAPRSGLAREIIGRRIGCVTRLVDDLLDLSRIDTGKIRLERTRFDARDLVRRACEDVRPLFEERGVELALDVTAEPLWVDADEARLTQVVANLLGNALKFTPPGGAVGVAMRLAGGDVELRVQDTGEGIDPRFLDQLFERFAQAEQTLETGRGGLGIGLALVKHVVAMHGGTVGARSEGKGKGAEFIVSLPLAPAPALQGAEPRRSAIPSLAILIVEDDREAAETLEQLLQLKRHRTRVALDGRSATEALLEWGPDVIISDVCLPDVSGYELMRRIREVETRNPAFCIAMTGYAQSDDLERARQAGFDAHLPKPASLERLDALLAEAAERRRQGSRRCTAQPPAEASPRAAT